MGDRNVRRTREIDKTGPRVGVVALDDSSCHLALEVTGDILAAREIEQVALAVLRRVDVDVVDELSRDARLAVGVKRRVEGQVEVDERDRLDRDPD